MQWIPSIFVCLKISLFHLKFLKIYFGYLCLRRCTQASFRCREPSHPSVTVPRPPLQQHLLLPWFLGVQVLWAHRLSCSVAYGIFPNQGSNPCPLYWQADSQPLNHQGSPPLFSFGSIFSHLVEFWIDLFLISAVKKCHFIVFWLAFFLKINLWEFYLFFKCCMWFIPPVCPLRLLLILGFSNMPLHCFICLCPSLRLVELIRSIV